MLEVIFQSCLANPMEICVTTASVSFWVQGCQLLLAKVELTFDDKRSLCIRQ